jgi:hypothetical protein
MRNLIGIKIIVVKYKLVEVRKCIVKGWDIEILVNLIV